MTMIRELRLSGPQIDAVITALQRRIEYLEHLTTPSAADHILSADGIARLRRKRLELSHATEALATIRRTFA